MYKFYILSLVFLLSCSSSQKETQELEEEIKAPIVIVNPQDDIEKPIQITFAGENSEGYFSPDGNKIIYKSHFRADHENYQIYEYNLLSGEERRITHQDGDATCPNYSHDGNYVLYSSTTDELKEEIFIKKAAPNDIKIEDEKLESPYEIYRSRIDGSEILRLTQSKGYDSEASFSPNGKSFLFSSNRNGFINLYQMFLHNRSIKRMTSTPDMDGGASFSLDGNHFVWRRFNESSGESQIWISDKNSKEKRVLTSKKSLHLSPFWHPDNNHIVFSSNREKGNSFDLFLIDKKGLCLSLLTHTDSNELYPNFDRKGKRLLFTSDLSGKKQIYIMNFNLIEKCADEIP